MAAGIFFWLSETWYVRCFRKICKDNFWRNYRIFHTTGGHKGITVKWPFNLFYSLTVHGFFNSSQFYLERSQLAWVCLLTHFYSVCVCTWREERKYIQQSVCKANFWSNSFWASFILGSTERHFFLLGVLSGASEIILV